MPVTADTGGKLVLMFGWGDISVCPIYENEEDPEVVFVLEPNENPIGTTTRKYAGRYTDEVDTVLRMIFHRRESLEVVIDALVKLRQSFDNHLSAGGGVGIRGGNRGDERRGRRRIDGLG